MPQTINYSDWVRLPYSTGEQSFSAGFNCWGLMQTFLACATGQLVHECDVDYTDAEACAAEAEKQFAKELWLPIEYPQSFCVVQMTHAEVPHHVGVYVPINGGMILHTTATTGSIYSKRHQLAELGFRIVGFYLLNEHSEAA